MKRLPTRLALALIGLCAIPITIFAQGSGPSISVNGASIALPRPAQRVGGEWFVPLYPIARALAVEVQLPDGGHLMRAQTREGTETVYDSRTGEIRQRFVTVGRIRNPQEVQLIGPIEMLLFPLSGLVTLFQVDANEIADRQLIEITTTGTNGGSLYGGAASLNITDLTYRFGVASNLRQHMHFLDLNGTALVGNVKTSGRALFSGSAGQIKPRAMLTTWRADWRDRSLVVGNQTAYAGIDAMNTVVRGVAYETMLRGFRASFYAGSGVSSSAGAIGVGRPAYDGKVAGVSMNRRSASGELAGAINTFRGVDRSGSTVGVAYASPASHIHHLKIQTLVGRFTSAGRTATAAGFSVANTFTPFKQLNIGVQYETYGRHFTAANADARFSPQTRRSMSAALQPFSFISLTVNASTNMDRDGKRSRHTGFGGMVSLPRRFPMQLGYFRSVQADDTSAKSSFALNQYSIIFPATGRFSGHTMLSEMRTSEQRIVNLATTVVAQSGKSGRLAIHNQTQFGNSHRLGFDFTREFGGRDSAIRFGLERLSSRNGSSFAPVGGLRLDLANGRTLQVSYTGGANTHMLQFEIGGRMRSRREINVDAAGNRSVTVMATLIGRVYVDADSNGSFEPKVDRPVQGVTVWLDDNHSATTSAQGTYVFTGVKPGAYRIRPNLEAVPAELTPAGAIDKIVHVAPHGRNVHDLPMVRTGRISGKVTYLDYSDIENPIERPLPDARVIATDRFDTYSEVDGQFLIGDLPPGNYELRLDPATVPQNYRPLESLVTIQVKAGEQNTGVRFQLVIPPKPVIERTLTSVTAGAF